MEEVAEIDKTNEVVGVCLDAHKRFDREVWAKEYSFHDESHISSVIASSDILIDGVMSGDDPLDLLGDLDRWNVEHPQNVVNPSEIKDVFRLAFAMHDLGNIAEKIDENGNFVFLEKYVADKAEERSIGMVDKLLKVSGVKKEEADRLSPLIKHIIQNTVFDPEDREAPFAIYTRVTDQIGNNYFSGKNSFDRSLSLATEIQNETKDKTFKPDEFINFTVWRFKALVPDEVKRAKILKIWNKQEVNPVAGLNDNEVSYEELADIVNEEAGKAAESI